MPISMTRAEYEAQYGEKPAVSTLDTTPAPISMTRAEYEAKYSEKPVIDKPVEKLGFLQTVGRGIERFKQSVIQRTGEAKKEISKAGLTTKPVQLFGEREEKGLGEAFLEIPGAIGRVGTDFTLGAFSGLIQKFEEKFPETTESIKQTGIELLQSEGGKLGIDALEGGIEKWNKFEEKNPDLARDLKNVSVFGEAVFELTGIGFVSKKVAKGVVGKKLPQKIKDIKQTSDTKEFKSIVDNLVNEIENVEQNYSKLRKAEQFSKGSDASRSRIAKSGVLDGAIDATGTIKTKQKGGAVEIYRKNVLYGAEGIVRKQLVVEGKTINLQEVLNKLTKEIKENSGLEGGDLQAAINGLQREIKGLAIRADEFGNIKLESLHDAKINTTKNINFQTPPETATFRKTIARSYKELIENKSDLPINTVNKELGKYLGDIKRLENLDGRKVRGGKLGKYTAQISGNIAGAAAGALVGGPGSMVIGTIVGGEIASMLKGKALKSVFSEIGSGAKIPKSKILEKAKIIKPKDLSKPDIKLGAPKSIPKTKEILKIEKDIAINVKAQKAAITKVNTELVVKLKVAYVKLVEKLKAIIKQIKETPNKQGGFIRLKSVSKPTKGKEGPLLSKIRKPSTNNITKGIKSKPILTLQTKRGIIGKDVAGNKFTIKKGETFDIFQDGNKYIIKGKETHIIPKNQYENLKGQSITSEVKEFAPELKGTKETVRGGQNLEDQIDNLMADELGENMTRAEARDFVKNDAEFGSGISTKFEQYTLPEGKNYKEILIQAPKIKAKNPYAKHVQEMKEKYGNDWNNKVTSEERSKGLDLFNAKGAFEEKNINFKSSHWEEPNVISHLRLNDRNFNGKKVTFMEELQSDWASELRKKGSDVPTNSLLKNWQESATKRALIEAVDNNSNYFAWINGKQTSARYDLATHLNDVKWGKSGDKGFTNTTLKTKDGTKINIKNNEKGIITFVSDFVKTSDWKGKKLDEVLGKGLADKIIAKETGTLSGEGLSFGGEWAINLYDKQVPNIVKKLTGGKIVGMDMKLPVKNPTKRKIQLINEKGNVIAERIFSEAGLKEYKDTVNVTKGHSIKFIEPESVNTIQQGIKLTPEIKAIIKGESPIPKGKGITNTITETLPLLLVLLGGGTVATQ